MIQSAAPKLLTASRIASELGQPVHRVNRVLETRHHIQPAAFAGRTRLYSALVIAQVRHELNAIDARRAGGQW